MKEGFAPLQESFLGKTPPSSQVPIPPAEFGPQGWPSVVTRIMRDQILLEELRLVMKEGFAPLQESFLGKKGFLEQQCHDTVFQELQIGRLVQTGRGATRSGRGGMREAWRFTPATAREICATTQLFCWLSSTNGSQ